MAVKLQKLRMLKTFSWNIYRRCNLSKQVATAVLLSGSRCIHCVLNMKNEQAESNAKSISSPMTGINMTTKSPTVKEKFGWIGKHVPRFGISGSNIDIIQEPIDFYESFKDMIGKAEKRIVIASLYLGTGALEKDLVQHIEAACERALSSGNNDFEVHILLDYNRGSRGVDSSSRTMLLPLLEKYSKQVHVYLYHTPDLRGLVKAYMPERFNETVGLTHMKVYLADDDFIISGANLSDSYFTNRQDRYIKFQQCPDMASYFCDMIDAVSGFSFHLQCNNTTNYPASAPHPYEGTDGGQEYKDYARKKVLDVNHIWKNYTTTQTSDTDTWLFPLIQMGPFKIKDDEVITENIFRQSNSCDKVFLASGYFNLTSRYMNVVLNESKADFEILTASPEANGFFGASGISGYVPSVYTLIAKQFYTQVCDKSQEQRISMYEYYRKHWTFHCKGLWYYIAGSDVPSLTLIGSPNFGYRSVYRDLETQVAVVTTNTSLQKQLKQEHERLYGCSLEISEKTFQEDDRAIPLLTRLVTRIIKNFF